ncbi:TPR repeat, SEL1 subfamily, partial [hydrothermal vent metagenome]
AAKKASKIDHRLSDLADQLNALSEKGQATAVNRFVEYDNEPVAERALEKMIERIERGEAQTGESFQAINTRLDTIDEKLTGSTSEEQDQSPEFKALESALRNIVDHIETSEKRNRDALGNMQDRMSDMTKKVEHAKSGAVSQTGPAIAALDARVAELAIRHEQAAASDQEETRTYLEERLAGIGEQIDAVRHSSDAMTKRAEVSAMDIAKKETRLVEQRVANLIGEARTLMVQSAPASDTLNTIRSEIESLNQRFDDIKADSASDQDVQSLKMAIEQLTTSVAAGPDSQPIAAMEQRLMELTQRLDEKPVTEHMAPQFAELEQRIIGLDQQLAATLGQEGDGAAFSALESQISMVADRMAATEEKLGALTTIEQSIAQLYSAIEENKTEVHTLAEGAATRVADEIMQQGMPVTANEGPSPELVALEQGLAAVRQSSQAAEQHNQETLEAVHETLEQIINKLSDMETHDATAPAAPQPAVETPVALPKNNGENADGENTSGADWQAAVQSHLQDDSVAQELQPLLQPDTEMVSDVSPAFEPGPVPDQMTEMAPEEEKPLIAVLSQPVLPVDIQINLSEAAFDQQTDVVQETAPETIQEAAEAPLDYIAQARLASQSASPQTSNPLAKGAGFLTDKIMPNSNSADKNGKGNAAKKSGSLFSLPFLTKKKVAADNDQPTLDPATSGESKTSRKRLIMAGLALLIAAGAFAFSKVGGNSGGAPAPTASVQEKVIQPKVTPAETPAPEQSSQTIAPAKETKNLVKQISLSLPQNNLVNSSSRPISGTVTAEQTGMPGPQALESSNQNSDPVLAAPTDPVITASLPPAPSPTHNIQSPLNIQTAARTAPPSQGAPQGAAAQNSAQSADPNLPPEAVGTVELRQAAAKGDSSAQFVIATRYADGKMLARDYAKAARWYQKAASTGLPPAQYRLGTLFERGNGVPKDLNAARLWYERAAENGNVKAMHNLAVIYASDTGGQTDFAKARKWFEKASNHGLKDSQYNLAVIFERGLTGKRDQKEAFYWYSLAAKRGDKDARVKAHTLKNFLSAPEIKFVEKRLAAWRPQPALKLGNYVAIKDTKWQVGTKAPAKPQLGEKPNLTGKTLVSQTQTLLTKMGFDIGKVDGVMGSRTANAVRLFQLQNGLQVNGMVTNGLLQQLQARS